MTENTANEASASIALRSIQETKFPPIPEDLLATLPRRPLYNGRILHDFRQPMTALFLAEATNPLQSVVDFLLRGGLFMWPLLICSIVALTVIILRSMALRRKNVLPLVIESEIERLSPGGNPERLSRIVREDDSSLARIARVALQHLRAPRSENIEAVETRARHEMVILERGLIVLEIITGIAPLFGLIGAVSGLVHVFSHLGLGTGAADTKAIALGIAEALNATVFGLSIAVPTLIAFSYFSKKVEVMSVEMETLVVELISKCYYGRTPEGMPRASRLGPRASDGARAHAVDLTSRSNRRHEVCRSETTRSLDHHRLAGRYPDDPAHLFCRLDHIQKRSAGSADQSAGIEDLERETGGDRACDRER